MQRRLLAAAFALAAAAPARADQPLVLGGTGVMGGAGGAQFVLMCPQDSFLAGAITRRGHLLDYYEPVCAHVEPGGGTGPHFEPFANWRGAGGRGGDWQREDCAPGFVVDSMFVDKPAPASVADQLLCGGSGPAGDASNPRAIVGCVRHVCRRSAAPFDLRLARPPDRDQPDPGWLACPAGQWAVGVYGRAGKLVDSIGLVCGPAFGPYATAHIPPEPSAVAVPRVDTGAMRQDSGLFEQGVNPNAFGN
jgi:hypothetical protein